MFEIHTTPKAQKQTRFAQGHAYDPSKVDKETLIWQMRAYAPNEPLSGPLSVDITFLLPIPQSVSQALRRQMISNVHQHIVKPDVDNLAYLITNAMKKLIYRDDSQIVRLCIDKRYDERPRTVVKVTQL